MLHDRVSSSPSLFSCTRRVIISRPMAKIKRRHLLFVFFICILFTFASVLTLKLRYIKVSLVLRELLASSIPAMISSFSNLPQCVLINPNSSTGASISAITDSIPAMRQLESSLGPSLYPGGIFVPKTCRPSHKIAVIVPYRDRPVHLKMFLRHMHPFLQRQSLHYTIFVVEQDNDEPFNRALLMNVGFKEALNTSPDFDCFIFHDVDLLPLDDRNYYSCGDQPVHLSATIDTHGDKLMYDTLFGGASMLTKEMMEVVNGFPNVYFGWGGEDDDMSYRVRIRGMDIMRYPPDVARYKMIRHVKADKQDRTTLLLNGRRRIRKDGLNSLKYERVGFALQPLFTWVKVSVNQSQIMGDQGLSFHVTGGS